MTAKRTMFDIDDLYRRYQAGESLKEVGDSIGIPFATIARWFRESGYARRTGSEAQRFTALRRTPEQRQALTHAAHSVVRGMTRTVDDLERRALGKQRTQAHQSAIERELLDMLPSHATACTAIGPYNVDITVDGIAVEIFGGGWHGGGRAAARWPKRIHYLLNAGWGVVVIWVDHRRYPLTVAAAEYVVALADQLCRQPTAVSQYRVIRGTGEEIIRGCAYDDHFPVIIPRGSGKRLWCDHTDKTG